MLTEWCPAPNTGIPQGPDASRVLGNFYLGAVDHVMANVEGVKYFRFMDDIRIVGPSRSAVIAALQVLDQECKRRGLALSTKKTEWLVGGRAIESMSETELDDAQYAFESDHADETAVRKQLASIFTKSCESDGNIKMRWARFALLRLFKMRDRSVLNIVLDSLEDFAPLGGLLPKYLHPWLRRHSVKKKITSFLENADRNTSPYLSCWLMAAMLDVADAINERWVSYARTIALKKTEPAYHRSVALNVLALGGQGRDIDAIRDVVRYEYDPEVVRAALVALHRVRLLTKQDCRRSQRIDGLESTVGYLRGQNALPSLVFRSRRNRLV